MKTVTFRVPKEIKEQMDRIDINWSEYLRRSVQDVLEQQKKRDLHERLSVSSSTSPPESGTAKQLIRTLRDRG